MAKRRKNEETELSASVSPFESPEHETVEAPEVKPQTSKKSQFEVCCTPGLNFAVGGKFYNTGSDNFITPNGKIYKGIANDQEAMQEIYEFGPIALNWIKAPKAYRAKWEKFI